MIISYIYQCTLNKGPPASSYVNDVVDYKHVLVASTVYIFMLILKNVLGIHLEICMKKLLVDSRDKYMWEKSRKAFE